VPDRDYKIARSQGYGHCEAARAFLEIENWVLISLASNRQNFKANSVQRAEANNRGLMP
jgi:hypothetical protein